jgi:hypothetical protein
MSTIFDKINALKKSRFTASGTSAQAQFLDAVAKKNGIEYAAAVYEAGTSMDYTSYYAREAQRKYESEFEKDVEKYDKLPKQRMNELAKTDLDKLTKLKMLIKNKIKNSELSKGIISFINVQLVDPYATYDSIITRLKQKYGAGITSEANRLSEANTPKKIKDLDFSKLKSLLAQRARYKEDEDVYEESQKEMTRLAKQVGIDYTDDWEQEELNGYVSANVAVEEFKDILQGMLDDEAEDESKPSTKKKAPKFSPEELKQINDRCNVVLAALHKLGYKLAKEKYTSGAGYTGETSPCDMLYIDYGREPHPRIFFRTTKEMSTSDEKRLSKMTGFTFGAPGYDYYTDNIVKLNNVKRIFKPNDDRYDDHSEFQVNRVGSNFNKSVPKYNRLTHGTTTVY